VLYAVGGYGMVEKLADALEADVRGLLEQPILYKDYRSAVNGAVGRYWFDQQDRTGRILSLATAIVSGQPSTRFLTAWCGSSRSVRMTSRMWRAGY